MKINELWGHDNILAEIVDRGSRKGEDDDLDYDSDAFYREGIPTPISVKTEDGTIKTGMVYLCPLCNGNGKNILKRVGRLNASHITQQAKDLFGGGCGVNRRDYRCVNGLMQDKSTGQVFWQNDEPMASKERPPKESDNIKVGIASFKEEEPELWGYMINICQRYQNEPDRNSSTRAAFAIYNDFINKKETSKTNIDKLKRIYDDSKKPSRTSSDTLYRSQRNKKLGYDPNKDKKGYAIDDRSQQTFRPKKT